MDPDGRPYGRDVFCDDASCGPSWLCRLEIFMHIKSHNMHMAASGQHNFRRTDPHRLARQGTNKADA